MKVFALVGLSGVGKTTLLRRLSGPFHFLHLEASELIASQKSSSKDPGNKALTMGRQQVLDNQSALVRAFQHRTANAKGLVVLASHVLIDGEEELIDIAPSVFKSMAVSAMYFLQDTPKEIFSRRLLDVHRARPKRTVEEIEGQQNRAICTAAHVARTLDIELHLITPIAWHSFRSAVVEA